MAKENKIKKGTIGELVFDDKNFNKHTEFGMGLLEKSLRQYGAGRSILVDKNNRIISGNGVVETAANIGLEDTLVVETVGEQIVVVKRTDVELDSEHGRGMAFADNATAAADLEWDTENLQEAVEEYAIEPDAWGVHDWDVEQTDDPEDPDEDAEEAAANKGYAKRDKIDFVEEMMNKAMQQYCGEFAEQIDHAMKAGWICTGMTPGYAKLQFLKAKYYGVRYLRKLSVIFTPQQFLTSANSISYYHQLKESAAKGKAGIAGFRSASNDNSLITLFSDSYPIGGARMPLDFPVELGRELISKFANKGRVLDPCHGWGGRLVSALLEEVAEYVGVDPSPDASAGVGRIYETYKEYQDTKVTLIRQCYEDTQIDGGFDFALTSPPYFDVEQYAGEEQAHVKYNNYERWRECFYRPLIQLTMERLKDDCYFALQVGSQSYPLRSDAIAIATELGYETSVYKEKCLSDNGKLHNTKTENAECVLLIKKTKK